MREGEHRYLEEQTNTVYMLQHGRGGFQYLTPEGGEPPILNRCCSMILVEYGPRTPKPLDNFECPICYTPWDMIRGQLGGLSCDIYIKGDTGHRFVLRENSVASFLEVVSNP
jgi:hypothetical protein